MALENVEKLQHLQKLSHEAYKSLTHLFSAHSLEALEIEILPAAIRPPEGEILILDGSFVGIPKKVLVAAFLRARESFDCARGKGDFASCPEALQATNIILLFDPEHLTAANYRKRYILSLLGQAQRKAAVDLERRFLDTILLSPLHRQSKSPTLWYHRWWLNALDLRLPGAKCSAEVQSTHEHNYAAWLQTEINAILKAGERHKNNYYAFQCGRRIIDALTLLSRQTTEVNWNRNEITNQVFTWCKSHPSDTSGWSFLLYLLQQIDCDQESAGATIKGSLDFAVAVQWRKEAFWNFIRSALGTSETISKEQRDNLTTALENAVLALHNPDDIHRVWKSWPQKALEWTAQNRPKMAVPD